MRLDGWEGRLAGLIERARHERYEFARHDCFRFACGVVEALTGVDRLPEFCDYRTEREAARMIARHGESFESAFDWFFGAPGVDVRYARRGDICLGPAADDGKPLGVCLGSQAAFLAPEGLMEVLTLECRRAWRVG